MIGEMLWEQKINALLERMIILEFFINRYIL